MNIHSILAVTDFSPQGEWAVLRAAMLARQQRCLLKIMYAPADLRGTIEGDAARNVKRRAFEIHTRFDILVKDVADTSGHLQSVVEEARWVDLLVIGPTAEGSTPAFFCSQPVERLRRSVHCPILVVRQDANHRYSRIHVAIDSPSCAGKLMQMARSLGRDAEVTEATTLGRDLTSGAEDRQTHSGAELIVVEGRRRCGLSDFLFADAANRVLRQSTSDVLWVPHGLRIEPVPGRPLAAQVPRTPGGDLHVQ